MDALLRTAFATRKVVFVARPPGSVERGTDLRNQSIVLIVLALLTCAPTSASAQKALKVNVNGKPSRFGALAFKRMTYVPIEALKEAGLVVKVTGGTVAIVQPGAQQAAGGTNQQGAVAGKGGEWLHNGLWRFRVLSITPADPTKDGPGWLARVEIRSSGKLGGYSPAGTGWQGMSIVLDDGNSVGARSDAVELRDPPLALGASSTQTLYFETESKSMPAKLILRFDPKGLLGAPPALRFTVPDPSFRVDVKNVVRPNC